MLHKTKTALCRQSKDGIRQSSRERDCPLDKRKVIYYENELEDEFSVAEITPRPIDEHYIYCHDSLFKKFTHFFWYRVVALPIAWCYAKLSLHHKVIGREKIKKYKKQAYFMYGNHTHDIGDAFVPTLINFPKDVYVIVHPNNVSIPYLGRVTPSMGAIPLPDNGAAYRNFMKAVTRRVKERHAIVIYPEAHIWPYYTGIRPFRDTSFHYPIKYGVPTFCFTNTYQKRKGSRKPKMVTYIDGPFYPDEEIAAGERKKNLRDKVYACMCERAKNSNAEVIKYCKKES